MRRLLKQLRPITLAVVLLSASAIAVAIKVTSENGPHVSSVKLAFVIALVLLPIGLIIERLAGKGSSK